MEKQRLRFTILDDIILIREVLSENPFENNEKWIKIQENVNEATTKPFSIRCLKEHLQHLIASFKKQDNCNKKKSGTEEEFGEFQILMHDLIDLSNEFKAKTLPKKSKKKCATINPGILARDESLVFSQLNTSHELMEVEVDSVFEQLFQEDDPNGTVASVTVVTDEGAVDDPPTPPRRSNSQTNLPNQPTASNHSAPLQPNRSRRRNPMIDYLREKQQNERSLKRQELAIQTKRMKLEETALDVEKEKLQLEKDKLEFEIRKFEVEARERETRLKMEMEERKVRIKAEQEQREIMFQGEREQRQILLELIKSIAPK